ncbi:DUF2283 domain-containing protein [bacterium]|nr:DUF2283 domain-containing protein [bacterium]
MAPRMTLKYDREADVLYLSNCPPYPEQESEEIGNDVIAHLNPHTGEVESLELLFFSTRLLRKDEMELPLTADMHLATSP